MNLRDKIRREFHDLAVAACFTVTSTAPTALGRRAEYLGMARTYRRQVVEAAAQRNVAAERRFARFARAYALKAQYTPGALEIGK